MDLKRAQSLTARQQELVDEGFVTLEQLHEALRESERSGRSLPRVLVGLGYMSQEELHRKLAGWLGYEYIDDLAERQPDPTATARLPIQLVERYKAVPFAYDGDQLVVAMYEPQNILALDDIRTRANTEVKVLVAPREDIEDLIRRVRTLDTSTADLLEKAAGDEDEDHVPEGLAAEDAPIVKAINQIIQQAVEQRASDVHIEPQEDQVRIRYRIDGVLHEVQRSKKSTQSGMVSRLKIMADLNIAEKRLPQDGRVTVKLRGQPIDLRVATLPTAWGEKVVLRVLDRSTSLLRLEDLGFLEAPLKRYEESFRKPYGAILVTGPTGSGKSTTLYGTLNVLNDPAKNIITVEDPVEYRMQGLNQVQVNPRAGLNFAGALRSILRSDPDIIMIGEIRDRETANIAVESALTGHLVLSTLHTNDAASAVTRLIEMQVEPFLVASAVDCVMAQRLARKLCDRCKEPFEPTPEMLEKNGFFWSEGDEVPKLYRPIGCNYCSKTGYRGRVALVEVMPVTEEIERLAVERRSSDDIKRVAIEQGMSTLREDGLEKVLLGWTSVEEVFRVVT